MRSQLVMYHANCSDGFCSAWLLKQAMPECELMPVSYGNMGDEQLSELLDKVRQRNVVIADFSFKPDVMIQIIDSASSVLLLDHHKTAEQDLETLLASITPQQRSKFDYEFNMDKSGAMIVYDWLLRNDYCIPRMGARKLTAYVQDRDLWLRKQPESVEINSVIQATPKTIEDYNLLSSRMFERLDDVVKDGRAMLRAQAEIIDSHVSKAVEKNFLGYVVPVVNATSLISDIAGKLAVGKPFACCYVVSPDGIVTYSLRSESGKPGSIDVGELAKSVGGGGHKHAAGFSSKEFLPENVPTIATSA